MFSQMTRMLDIIQDYLGYRGWCYIEQVVQSLDHNAIQWISVQKTNFGVLHCIFGLLTNSEVMMAGFWPRSLLLGYGP